MSYKITCFKCNWVRDQSGSAHHLCPKMSDFSFGHRTIEDWAIIADNCELFLPRQNDYNPECNAFMVWM